jgi:hypothetical protein
MIIKGEQTLVIRGNKQVLGVIWNGTADWVRNSLKLKPETDLNI